MIAALIVIALALAWLALETNLLHVRLPMGVSAPLTQEVRRPWYTFDWDSWVIDPRSINVRYNLEQNPERILKDWKTPLCGWDWITGREHIIPEYDVEFSVAGCRYKMHLNSTDKAAKALSQVMKVNTKKHRPNPLPKLTYKGNKPKRIRKTAARASVNCA